MAMFSQRIQMLHVLVNQLAQLQIQVRLLCNETLLATTLDKNPLNGFAYALHLLLSLPIGWGHVAIRYDPSSFLGLCVFLFLFIMD